MEIDKPAVHVCLCGMQLGRHSHRRQRNFHIQNRFPSKQRDLLDG